MSLSKLRDILRLLILIFRHCFQVENETLPVEQTQEESEEEDDEGEESGRIRFKSERKEGAVVRLADAGSKRRNIPETLGMHLFFVFFFSAVFMENFFFTR